MPTRGENRMRKRRKKEENKRGKEDESTTITPLQVIRVITVMTAANNNKSDNAVDILSTEDATITSYHYGDEIDGSSA